MKALVTIAKTREYLDYLEEHVSNVEKAWKEVIAKCKDMPLFEKESMFLWLQDEIIDHDISKLQRDELAQYRESFYPAKHEAQKQSLGDAWEHHKLVNMHHHEAWTSHTYADPEEWKIHCAHMIIDWTAMGYKFGDCAQDFYESARCSCILNGEKRKFMYNIFKYLGGQK